MQNTNSISLKQEDIVLSGPTRNNPIPTLVSVCKTDNREQLVSLLRDDPRSNATTFMRHLLIFSDPDARSLLLRQVLVDPHQRSLKGKQRSWEAHSSFSIPREFNVVGCQVLFDQEQHVREASSAQSVLKIHPDQVDVVTYFVNPALINHTVQLIAHIRNHIALNRNRSVFHRVVYQPRASDISKRLIFESNLANHASVSLSTLEIDLVPLESDLLSLEMPHVLKTAVVDGTPSQAVDGVARSLLKVQDIVGKIPRIQSYGSLAEEVLRKMLSLSVDEALSSRDQADSSGDVEALVIIDRQIDLISPLVSPLTYEGLLDEVVGIRGGFVNVALDVIQPEAMEEESDKESAEFVALSVNASDPIYVEVRDQHVHDFGTFLQQQIVATRDSQKVLKEKDLEELHQFVKTIPTVNDHVRSLTNHIHLAELVKRFTLDAIFRERWQLERAILEGSTDYDALDGLIASQYHPIRLLRLLCLQSLCTGGIKSSRYDGYKRDIVQTYGYEYLFILGNLEKAGLLRRREGLWMDSASSFAQQREHLSLINAEVDTSEPDDISYVTSGYSPLSVRIIQTAVKRGWDGRDSAVIKSMPGRYIDILQQESPSDMATAMGSVGAGPIYSGGKKREVLLVCYVGGISYPEIAALRFLNRRENFPYRIVCMTSNVVGGNSFLESIF